MRAGSWAWKQGSLDWTQVIPNTCPFPPPPSELLLKLAFPAWSVRLPPSSPRGLAANWEPSLEPIGPGAQRYKGPWWPFAGPVVAGFGGQKGHSLVSTYCMPGSSLLPQVALPSSWGDPAPHGLPLELGRREGRWAEPRPAPPGPHDAHLGEVFELGVLRGCLEAGEPGSRCPLRQDGHSGAWP